MKPIIIHLTNLQPGANFVRVGIPCPQGVVTDCTSLKITDHDGLQINAAISPTANWPDSSVKWCLAKIALVNSTTSELKLSLKADTVPCALPTLVAVSHNTSGIVIHSGSATFEFPANAVFPSVTANKSAIWQAGSSYPLLTRNDGTQCDFEIDDISIVEQDNISCKLAVHGTYQSEPNQIINAKFIFEVLPHAQLSLVCEIHNSQRAMHPGGIWDLGDTASFQFKDFSIVMQHEADCSSKIKPEPDAEAMSTRTLMAQFAISSVGTSSVQTVNRY